MQNKHDSDCCIKKLLRRHRILSNLRLEQFTVICLCCVYKRKDIIHFLFALIHLSFYIYTRDYSMNCQLLTMRN